MRAASGRLDRRELCRAILADRGDMLVVAGLGAPAWDITAVGDRAENFPLWGGMGAAAMIGLGLALARPDRRVLVITGDGELLMNSGALATIGIVNPPNLSVVCVDNGHYGETGYQKSHTSLGVDLEKIAAGSGIKRTLTIETEAEIADGTRLIREGNGTAFVLLRVKPTEPPAYKRDLNPAVCRVRFRAALARGAGAR
jgi:thiamine pyrophosphate-dependent acetolactate synthase large subunit-like protein